jgi:2-(1,2-epoxy-1,2-dihydrophenyl)acetyl-CoA isomerase
MGIVMENIVVSIDAEGIALIELNRARTLNALNSGLMADLCAALAELAANDAVRVLIITGRGRAFCAGADLGQAFSSADDGDPGSPGELVAERMAREFNPMMAKLYAFPRPVISALNGIAAGGGAGLALCADLVIASDTAAIRVVQVPQLGIVADLGVNWLLPRIAGRSRAMAMCLLGDSIPAETLKDWGLVFECVAPESLLDTARDYARRLAGVPVDTLVATRSLVDGAAGLSFNESLEEERMAQRTLCDAPVFMESVGRFMAKN